MFYCNDCAKECGYPETITKSQGPCECCGKVAICNDMPSSKLSKREFYCDTETTGLNPKNQMSYPVGIGKVDANYHPLVNPRIKPSKGIYPIIDVPSDGKPKWYGGARCMMFVYSKHKGNFILRGFSDEVENYLKKNYTHYFYYISMWNAGQSRGYWHFWKNGVTILSPERKGRNKRWQYVVHKSFSGGRYNDLSELKQEKPVELKFKRLPKQWIPEFDQL